LYIPVVNVVLCVATLAVLLLFRDSEHISAAYGLALTITMITTTILLGIYLWHRSNKFGAVVFTIVFLAIQVLFFAASMAKFLHGGWFTLLLTLAILMIMYTWNEGTKLERSQRRHMMPKDFLPALDKLHGDSRIHRFADNIVYLTSDPDLKRLDTDIFFSIFADHPKRARAWWAVAVETTDEPFTREVESFGTDYLFRVRIRLGFKVSQSIPAYLHQIMHDLEKTGELPNQQSIYPKLDADPGIGTIRYVVIHKALMPESKVSGRGALSLQIKYAIRRVAGSPVKWFGLAPYNPLVEVQPLFVSTRRPPRLTRVASQAPKREG
ncbi:KUP/HAK/KT family potassium transporter, partial [Bifidobacterium longum]